MHITKKQAVTFIIALLLVITAANILARMLPVQPLLIGSSSMEPAYNKYHVVFVLRRASIAEGDAIAYNSVIGTSISRIIEKNPDSTYLLQGDNNILSASHELQVSSEQIDGKVIGSLNPWIFYVLVYAVQVLLAAMAAVLWSRRRT